VSATGPKRGYCLLVWAAIGLLPMLLVAALALPWVERVAGLDSEIADARDQLTRYRRLIASLPLLQAEIQKVNSNQAFKAFYFEAPTPALAGAELQHKVQDIVNRADGRLISTQILPEQENERPPRVRVRIQIQGSTETLLKCLYEIERARPFLFVDKVSVRSSARPRLPQRVVRGRRIRRRRPANRSGELTMRLDVFGFVLGPKG